MEVEAIFFGIAAAFWVAVWAMSPSKGAGASKGKATPLVQNTPRSGGL